MEPKSGSPVSLVAPAVPKEALAADVADPGALAQAIAEQIQAQKGKYGEVPVEPFKPPTPAEKKEKTSWVEVELVGRDDKPLPGEAYKIVLPDGRIDTGTTNDKGKVRIEGIDPGTVKISFPDLDGKQATRR